MDEEMPSKVGLQQESDQHEIDPHSLLRSLLAAQSSGQYPADALEEGCTSVEDLLQGFLAAGDSYSDALKICLESVEAQLRTKSAKEDEMRIALRSADPAPVTAYLFRTPYFVDSTGAPAPPINSEMEMGFAVDMDDPHQARLLWMPDEDDTLRELVIRRKKQIYIADVEAKKIRLEKKLKELQRALLVLSENDGSTRLLAELELAKISNRLAKPTEKTLEEIMTAADPVGTAKNLFEETAESLKDLDHDYHMLENHSVASRLLLGIPLKSYDWFDIAINPKLKRHGEEGCRLRFENLIDPGLKRPDTWTGHETAQLEKYVKVYGEHNWNEVAKRVYRRTAVMCCSRYANLHKSAGAEEENEEARTQTRFTAEEMVRLIHAVTVTQGVWANVSLMVPGKNTTQCKRFWNRHFELDSSRNTWTRKEIDLVSKFGQLKREKRLNELYRAMPDRHPHFICRLVDAMFVRDKGKNKVWVPIPDFEVPDVGAETYKSAILKQLFDHVLVNVTEPLREDPSLNMDTLLSMADVMNPLALMLTDLGLLLPHDTSTGIEAARSTLSTTDRQLIEALIAPQIKLPKYRGRKRAGNYFGSIPAELQPADEAAETEVLASCFVTAHESQAENTFVHLPPSMETVTALIKLKETVTSGAVITEYQVKSVKGMCEEADFRALDQRVRTLFLSTEIMRKCLSNRMERTGDDTVARDEAQPEHSGAPQESQPPAPRRNDKRPRSNKANARRRLKWLKEKTVKEREEKTKEREEKMKRKPESEEKITKKRKVKGALPTRQGLRGKEDAELAELPDCLDSGLPL